jgi:hypothetical protein
VTAPLKAPFPAFGGKSQVAKTVWPRLGPVRNYIEPFAFSAAMLLLRPDEPQIETINDLNSFVANFWRAIQGDPEAVADAADWPVNEADLHARHNWLVNSHDAKAALEKVRADPDAYDAKIAGWWCWGACMWIGSGWCETRGAGWAQVPASQKTLTGVHLSQQIPMLCTDGAGGRGVLNVWQQRPVMDGSRGIIVSSESLKRPQLCIGNSTRGPGVHKHHDEPGEKRPCLTREWSRGTGVHSNDRLTDCQVRRLWLLDWFDRLSDRLRAVRVCCGHWARVCDSESTLNRLGTTGVFLDPPYRKTVNGEEVQEWCLKWGGNRDIRIIVCGLEGEYPKLDAAGWEKIAWKSRGGYGNRSDRGKENRARERMWCSPACLHPDSAKTLFCGSEVA